MKTKYRICLFAVLSVAVIACSNNAESTIQEGVGEQSKVRMEDTITDAALAAKNKNLKQMSFSQLVQYVPDDVEGFTSKEPMTGEDGGYGKSGSRYFSFVSKTYNKNNESVQVEIIDYTPDTAQYHGLLNMYGFNTGIDNDVLRTKKIDVNVPGTKAIATEYKAEKTSKIIIGAGDRVLVVITGIQVTDIALLEKFARKIKLKELIQNIQTQA